MKEDRLQSIYYKRKLYEFNTENQPRQRHPNDNNNNNNQNEVKDTEGNLKRKRSSHQKGGSSKRHPCNNLCRSHHRMKNHNPPTTNKLGEYQEDNQGNLGEELHRSQIDSQIGNRNQGSEGRELNSLSLLRSHSRISSLSLNRLVRSNQSLQGQSGMEKGNLQHRKNRNPVHEKTDSQIVMFPISISQSLQLRLRIITHHNQAADQVLLQTDRGHQNQNTNQRRKKFSKNRRINILANNNCY